MQQAAGRAKNNIIRATEELVKELKGDVPQGRNTFYSQWDHSEFPQGERGLGLQPYDLGTLSAGTMEERF